MPTITRDIIRVAVDAVLARGKKLKDALTGKNLEMWHGEDVAVQVGFFENGVLVGDISNFASATCEVKALDGLDAAPLLTKDVAVPDLLQNLTIDHWNDGTLQHAEFVFTNSETSNIDLKGRQTLTAMMFFWATTNDVPARRVGIGNSILTIRDNGVSGAVVVTPPGARMKNNKLQVMNPDTNLYYDVVVRVEQGQPVLSLEGAGEA